MASPERSSSAHASVAFFRIDGFAERPVAEQARLKTKLQDAIERYLAVLRADERIVLDASDGAAVVVLAKPRGALELAWRVLGADRELPLSAGLTHGPVRVAEGDDSTLHGDGLASAETIAAFAPLRVAYASREFRDALARSAPDAARLLGPLGSRLDASDRSHDLFTADEHTSARRRRRFALVTAAACAGILAIGVTLRIAGVGTGTGTVVFDIRPAGEVFVDGVSKGSSPPLKRLQLPAGRHEIEVRNAGYRPLVTELTVGAGEELVVEHSFTAPQPSRPAWRRFLDKFKP